MCLNPTLIVNPTAKRFEHVGKITDSKRLFPSITAMSLYYDVFNRTKGFSDEERYELGHYCRVIVGNVEIPAYIMAGCGKCEQCRLEKKRDICDRMLFEAADSRCAFFFTLTYDDEHLPADGLQKSDVSKFLKRFREKAALNLIHRFPQYSLSDARSKLKFRCFYVGEYGTRSTHRPHYHGIMFFESYITYPEQLCLYDGFISSWPSLVKDFQRVRTLVGAAKYVAKYILKQDYSYVPFGKNPLFYMGPRRPAGLGCLCLYNRREELLKSPDGYYTLNIDNKLVRVRISPVIVNKLFPSFSRDFPGYSSFFSWYHEIMRELIKRVDLDSPLLNYFADLNTDLKDYIYLVQGVKCKASLYSCRKLFPNYKCLDAMKPNDFQRFVIGVTPSHRLLAMLKYIHKYLCFAPNIMEFYDVYMSKNQWTASLERPPQDYDKWLEWQSSLVNIHTNEVNYITSHMLT